MEVKVYKYYIEFLNGNNDFKVFHDEIYSIDKMCGDTYKIRLTIDFVLVKCNFNFNKWYYTRKKNIKDK